MPDPTNPIAATIASVPALHANCQSAACTFGTAPMASATTVEVGLTDTVRFGADPDCTHFGGRYPGAQHGIARGFDRHRGNVFVQTGHRLFFNRQRALTFSPNSSYLASR